MKVTHFVPIKGKYVFLHQEIFSEMGIENGCHLYAMPVNSEPTPTLILSPIPPYIWERAHKLIVNLSKKPGSLLKLAEILRDNNINIFSSYASAVNAHGQTSWSSIVELPKGSALKDISDFEKIIKEEALEKEVLPENSVFPKDLKKILITPLKVLQAWLDFVEPDKSFIGKVNDYSLNLGDFFDNFNNSLYETTIVDYYTRNGFKPPNYCVLSTDTQEKYFRITFLPLKYQLRQLNMEIKITSKNANFEGYFGSVLKTLFDKGFNVYSSNILILSKKQKETPRINIAEEEARFSYILEISNSNMRKSIPKMQKDLLELIKKGLNSHTDEQSKIEIIENTFKINDLQRIFPVCFLATNARTEEESFHFVKKLYLRLKSQHFEPLNVDIAKKRTIFEEVTPLIKASVILVSLHLPVSSSKLVNIDENLGEKEDSYNPMDWVMFEESYALGLGKRVFRLRHKDVRSPRYSFGERDFVFDDENFSKTLDMLCRSIDAEKRSQSYLEALAKTEQEIISQKYDYSLLLRNLDEEYLI